MIKAEKSLTTSKSLHAKSQMHITNTYNFWVIDHRSKILKMHIYVMWSSPARDGAEQQGQLAC